jgi:micrococcal nuclease
MIKLLILALTFFISQNLVFNAKVIGITDGDTIVVLKEDNIQVKIRLEGIDCPESSQDFGNRAKQAAVDLCFKKYVHVRQSGTDRYGRMLAFVYVDSVNINKELIKLGMAWHFKKYNSDSELADLEVAARNQKVGLWSQPNPEAPWDYRLIK